MMRSRIPSARVESPIWLCHLATGSCEVSTSERVWERSSGGFGTSYVQRGNVTTVSRWAHNANVTTDKWINTCATYDIAGNVRTVTDGNGNSTALSFVDSFSNSSTTLPSAQKTYAFPTTVTDSLSNATTLMYDYYIGKATSMRDPNQALTTFDYTTDPLDRLKKVTYPVGTIQYSYDDTPNKPIVTTTKSINSCGLGNSLVSEAIFDGLGREKITSAQTGSSNWISTVQTYDALGRVSAVSNPYTTGPSPDSTSATAWRHTSYDAINRVKQTTDTDSAITGIQYSGQAAISAEQAEVTDPSGIVRRNLTAMLWDAWSVSRRIPTAQTRRSPPTPTTR